MVFWPLAPRSSIPISLLFLAFITILTSYTALMPLLSSIARVRRAVPLNVGASRRGSSRSSADTTCDRPTVVSSSASGSCPTSRCVQLHTAGALAGCDGNAQRWSNRERNGGTVGGVLWWCARRRPTPAIGHLQVTNSSEGPL